MIKHLIQTHLSVTKGQTNLKSGGSDDVQPVYKCVIVKGRCNTFFIIISIKTTSILVMLWQHHCQHLSHHHSQGFVAKLFTYQGRHQHPVGFELLSGNLKGASVIMRAVHQ